MAEVIKKKYQVRQGRTFGVNNAPAGTIVELSDEEAWGLRDMVELLDGGDVPPQGISPALTPEVKTPADAAPAPGADKAPEDDGKDGSGEQTPADDDAFDQTNSTVEEVLTEVKAGRLDAKAALEVERKGKKRATLIAELEKLSAS